jgi:MFS family permease
MRSSSMGIGLIDFVAIFGTLVLGRFSDRLPRRNILAAIYAVRGLGFFALGLVRQRWRAAAGGRDRVAATAAAAAVGVCLNQTRFCRSAQSRAPV